MKKTLREQIRQLYGGACSYCGNILDDKWQVDHKISKQYWPYYGSEVPVEDEENLVPACRECNHYKREKCVESKGHHKGYREYMLTFHKRLAKLPKNTEVPRTQRRKEYMWTIANKYSITPDKPWSGVFYMDNYEKEQYDSQSRE